MNKPTYQEEVAKDVTTLILQLELQEAVSRRKIITYQTSNTRRDTIESTFDKVFGFTGYADE